MKHALYLITIWCLYAVLPAEAQHVFSGTSLSEALITLDKSSKRWDVNFVYDELEDFTVSKTISRGRSLPDAVREACGFYPVRVSVRGRDIFVECVKKDRTKLSGRLVDGDRQPVAYANITLFQLFDSTYVGGGVSNEAGDFVIPCGEKEARVRISCIGFKTIERQMPIGHVGTIRMQMENNYLSPVIVNGRLSVIRSEADRLQYIVANDQFAKGQTALELLSRVPMVTMMNGRASILGKGQAGFMFNGRVALLDDEAIRQRLWALQSDDIERIEVISNPSGRHQMDGAGGYINIVTYSGQMLGWRGDLTATGARSEDWSHQLSGSASYASRQFDMTLGADMERTTSASDQRTTYEFAHSQMTSQTYQGHTDKNLGAHASLRFLPLRNVELGTMVSYRHQKAYMDLSDETAFVGTKYSEGRQQPVKPADILSLTAYCDWTLDSLGKQFSLTYNHYLENDDDRFTVTTSIPFGGYYKSRCLSDSRYAIRSLKLDAVLPFRQVTFEAGVAFTHVHNESGVQDKRILMGFPRSWSTDYDYQEKTKAFYLNLSRTFHQRLTAKAGIRLEQTKLRGHERFDVSVSNLTNTPYNTAVAGASDQNNRQYSSVLPSLFLGYRFRERQQMGLSWNMGISRPQFFYLNPFEVYSSSTSIKTGNPALLPSTSNNVELSYASGSGLDIVAYYHHGHDMIDWITAFHPEVYSQNGAVGSSDDQRNYQYYQVAFEKETRPLNCFSSDQAGLYLRWQHQVGAQLHLSAEGDVYHYAAYPKISGNQFLSEHIAGNKTYRPIGMPDLKGWGERVAISADLFLNRQHSLLLSARYDHTFAAYEALTSFSGYGYATFALRYSLLNDRLKLSLTARDPFRQHILDGTRRYNDELFTERFHLNPHAHCVSLTASFSLGGKSVRRIQRDTKDTESQRADKH